MSAKVSIKVGDYAKAVSTSFHATVCDRDIEQPDPEREGVVISIDAKRGILTLRSGPEGNANFFECFLNTALFVPDTDLDEDTQILVFQIRDLLASVSSKP